MRATFPTLSIDELAPELSAAIGACRSFVRQLVVASIALNLLVLAGSIYMTLIYDVVLPGGSRETLTGLAVIVTAAYIFQAALDLMRTRMLIGIGLLFDGLLTERTFSLMMNRSLGSAGPQLIRDLDNVRSFLTGSGPVALIDMPWMIFFVTVLFFIHWTLGLTALVSGLVLLGLTLLADRRTGEPARRAASAAAGRASFIDQAFRHADVIDALGMRGWIVRRWSTLASPLADAQRKHGGASATFGSVSRVFRLFTQSMVLTAGALLVLDGKASAGIMFASSILTSRALAPVESAIANWKGLAAARLSFARLNDQLKAMPARPPRLPLPAPERHFVVEDLSVKAPLGELPIVTRVSFRLEAGDGLALIGPSGGGKSTLLHGLIGIWPIEAGEVRFDGAAISQWEPDAIGRHIGYLPQSVELMSGTIAENISRFDPAATMDDIIAAARQAAVHDLVLRMPKGYETPIGSDGQSLSAGQRQRIGLARALYRNPFLVVLDEPNSNLDVEGEAALAAAVIAVRQRKGIVIIAAHRIEILKVLNKIGEMRQGQLAQFGPRDAIWKGILDRAKSLRPVKTEITAVRDA